MGNFDLRWLYQLSSIGKTHKIIVIIAILCFIMSLTKLIFQQVSHGAIQFTAYEELRKVIVDFKSKGSTVHNQNPDKLLVSERTLDPLNSEIHLYWTIYISQMIF